MNRILNSLTKTNCVPRVQPCMNNRVKNWATSSSSLTQIFQNRYLFAWGRPKCTLSLPAGAFSTLIETRCQSFWRDEISRTQFEQDNESNRPTASVSIWFLSPFFRRFLRLAVFFSWNTYWKKCTIREMNSNPVKLQGATERDNNPRRENERDD